MRLSGAPGGLFLVLTGSLAGLGCSAPVADVADASGTVTQGLVLVERSTADGAAPQTNVSAKFMRLSATADPDLVERVVGSTFDRPSTGECAAMSAFGGDEPAAGLSALGSIELLDVGDVTVRTRSLGGTEAEDNQEMPLAARAFPDVGDLVFGVFYTSRDAASDLPAPARYAFETSGSALLDRFAFEAEAPPGIEEIRIDEDDLADGVDLVEGSSAALSWAADASHAQASADDLVIVDLSAASGAIVRCTFKDEGHGVIPGAFLRAEALGPLPASLTITVHRVREASFSATGMDLGEVRFDLSLIGHVDLTYGASGRRESAPQLVGEQAAARTSD